MFKVVLKANPDIIKTVYGVFQIYDGLFTKFLMYNEDEDNWFLSDAMEWEPLKGELNE